jgi:leader peptidase (prepilin peptidase)/N-methyltransferase
MTVLTATGATALTLLLLAALAYQRKRAYRLVGRALNASGAAIAIALTLVRLWLAWRGIGGIETSIAVAVGAVASITDLQYGYVFDNVLIAAAAALVVVAAVQGNVVGAMTGATTAALLLGIPWAMSGARGMGLGDVKLAGVLGLALGPYGAMRAVWFSFVVGAIVATACVVTRRRKGGDSLPFAPFLTLGAVLSVAGAAL